MMLLGKGITEHVPYETTIDGMMEWMRSVGEPHITTIRGNWWCYFKTKKGAATLAIDGVRFEGQSLFASVTDCYHKVRGCWSITTEVGEAVKGHYSIRRITFEKFIEFSDGEFMEYELLTDTLAEIKIVDINSNVLRTERVNYMIVS